MPTPSSGFSRFYGRASQALLGIVGSRNGGGPTPKGADELHTSTGTESSQAVRVTTAGKKSNHTTRRSRKGPSTASHPEIQPTPPIPVANTNSGSTATATTNPSVNSGLSSSSSSSGSNALASATSIPKNAAGTSQAGGNDNARKSRVKKRGVVHLEDIPGSRVGPDDVPWPKEYEILETEEDVFQELRSLGRPHRAVFVNYERNRSRSRSRGDRSRSNGRSTERGVMSGAGEGELTGESLAPVLPPVQENPVPSAAQPVTEPRPDLPRVLVVDSVNLQPCKTLKTQDRYVVTQLEVHGEMWSLTGVFDGHLGDVTVEHVAHHLPIIIREFLKSKLPSDFTSSDYDPEHISNLFQSAIAAFDDAIAHDILDLFGGSVDQLSNYSDADIRRVINDNHQQGMYGSRNGSTSGENWRKARLCMYGTTALVALMDPKGEGVWVANLGDCTGILVTRTITLDESDEEESDGDALPSGFDDPELGEWSVEILTTMHNGDNDKELERIRGEHPGEDDTCISDRRVLGALAPTRCLGDIPFKQPPEFTRRILYNLYPYVHNTAPWEEFLKNNLTPPYISSQAEVTYRRVKGDGPDPSQPTEGSGKRRNSGISAVLSRFGSMKRGRKAKKQAGSPRVKKQRYLVLASDGFTDLCLSHGGIEKVVKAWAKEMVEIGSPHKEVEETKVKLRDRAKGTLDYEEDDEIVVPVPLAKPAPIAVSQVATFHFAFGDTESSPVPVSPVSATSPVPFTANSFSSSAGSLAIPTLDQEEESTSGMSTPAYAFSIPPTRAASPHLQQSPTQQQGPLGASSPQRQHSFVHAPLPSHPHLHPHAQAHAALLTPHPVSPQVQAKVPRLQRPPLPHTNKSYHCISSSNMALRLLRCALGGTGRENDRVAKALTIDMDVSWLDDTAIVVLGL